jgi:hypothetical protein
MRARIFNGLRSLHGGSSLAARRAGAEPGALFRRLQRLIVPPRRVFPHNDRSRPLEVLLGQAPVLVYGPFD